MEETHSSDWDLSIMCFGVIPATGKHLVNQKEKLTVTIKYGKVVKCEIEVPDNGGSRTNLIGMFFSKIDEILLFNDMSLKTSNLYSFQIIPNIYYFSHVELSFSFNKTGSRQINGNYTKKRFSGFN